MIRGVKCKEGLQKSRIVVKCWLLEGYKAKLTLYAAKCKGSLQNGWLVEILSYWTTTPATSCRSGCYA
jgi:hypothetical protein